jgi:Tfp pilus assembly protein PilO
VKALFAVAADVGLSRVLAEQRAWLWPIGLAMAANVLALALVVVPLQRTVESGGARAASAAQALAAASAEFKNAEATRDGQAQADRDLDRFYKDVLPTDVAAARRMTQLKLNQMARKRGVIFHSSATVTETIRESELERLSVSFMLSGDYDDIRQFIYDIETGQDFLVIDNLGLSAGADPNAPLALTLELSTYYRVGPHDR